MAGITATDNPEVVRDLLLPGDLLLFDSMSWIAGLTQWADQSPFNHVGLVVDDTFLVEANRGAAEPCREHDIGVGGKTAVRRVCLHRRLAAPGISTVTVLRHRDAGTSSLEPVLARAGWYLERADRFSVLDLALIGQERFLINYRTELIQNRDLWLALKWLSLAAISSVGTGQHSVSCSELVYRCFVESAVATFDLHRTTVPRVEWPMAPGDEEAKMITDLEELRARLAAHNAEADGKSGEDREDGGGTGDRPVLPDADRASPGDFARSDDFVRVAVLTHDRAVVYQPEHPPTSELASQS